MYFIMEATNSKGPWLIYRGTKYPLNNEVFRLGADPSVVINVKKVGPLGYVLRIDGGGTIKENVNFQAHIEKNGGIPDQVLLNGVNLDDYVASLTNC